jgi:hypothetical protein
MLDKNDVRDSVINEMKIVKQLVSKLPEGSEDFRLSEGQRSTIELLRYIALMGPGVVHAGNDSGFGWIGENAPAMETVGLEEMPSHLDGAIAEMKGLFENMSDEDFASKPVSVEGMGEWTMQTWLLNTVCKFVPAYKLMLFHHAKAAGNTDIGTWDAWLDNGEVPAPNAG